MKKIFLYILAGSLSFTACKKDDEVETYKEPEDITVQNNYDDQAIKKFMDENYLDAQGNIKLSAQRMPVMIMKKIIKPSV